MLIIGEINMKEIIPWLILIAFLMLIFLPLILFFRKKKELNKKELEYQMLHQALMNEQEINADINGKQALLEQLDQDISIKLVTPPEIEILDSLELKNALADIREEASDMIKDDTAVDTSEFAGSKKIYKSIKNAIFRTNNLSQNLYRQNKQIYYYSPR